LKPALIVASLLAILAVAAAGAYAVWRGIEGSAISMHGTIALGLGVLVTVALGAGLMFLVFYSSRRGYDDIDAPPPDQGDGDR
jgi:membrane protein implicated in regulation of membrane protease activity